MTDEWYQPGVYFTHVIDDKNSLQWVLYNVHLN